MLYKYLNKSKFWGINKLYFVLDLDIINFRGSFDKMILLSLAS